MGPAWLAVGIYLTLKHIVKAFGPQYSYLKPKYYTWLFIAGDCFALSLQAVGGGLSAGAIGNFNQLSLGSNIAIAGIIMQVVTLAIFAALAGLFFFRRQLARRNGVPEKEGTLVNPQLQTLRFKLFAGAVIIAFSTIFTRCVYRIAEMMGGWGDPLMQDGQRDVFCRSYCIDGLPPWLLLPANGAVHQLWPKEDTYHLGEQWT